MDNEAPEKLWLLRNEDGTLDDCWQMSTVFGTADAEYTRSDVAATGIEKAWQQVWQGIETAPKDRRILLTNFFTGDAAHYSVPPLLLARHRTFAHP